MQWPTAGDWVQFPFHTQPYSSLKSLSTPKDNTENITQNRIKMLEITN